MYSSDTYVEYNFRPPDPDMSYYLRLKESIRSGAFFADASVGLAKGAVALADTGVYLSNFIGKKVNAGVETIKDELVYGQSAQYPEHKNRLRDRINYMNSINDSIYEKYNSNITQPLNKSLDKKLSGYNTGSEIIAENFVPAFSAYRFGRYGQAAVEGINAGVQSRSKQKGVVNAISSGVTSALLHRVPMSSTPRVISEESLEKVGGDIYTSLPYQFRPDLWYNFSETQQKAK